MGLSYLQQRDLQWVVYSFGFSLFVPFIPRQLAKLNALHAKKVSYRRFQNKPSLGKAAWCSALLVAWIVLDSREQIEKPGSGVLVLAGKRVQGQSEPRADYVSRIKSCNRDQWLRTGRLFIVEFSCLCSIWKLGE